MAEALRLLAHATEALVDRSPIDWAALLSRVSTPEDRALFENLRVLASVRDAGRPVQRLRSASRGSVLAAWLLVAIASIEIAYSFGVLGVAFASGETSVGRAPQLVLALAFAVASLALGMSTSRDPRSVFLLATFSIAASVFARSVLTGLPRAWSAPMDAVLRGIALEAFMPACLWQFALDFPRVRRFTSFDVHARRATAAAWLLGLSLLGAGGVVAAGALFWYVLTLALIPPIGAILVRSRRAPLSERRKVMRFAVALAGGTAPFLLCGAAGTVWPRVDAYLTTITAQTVWLDHLLVAALAATPILGTAAVIADGPLEFQVVLWRVSRHTLVRSALTATSVASFAAAFLMLYSVRHLRIADIFSNTRAWLLLSSAAAGCLLLTARARLLSALDQRVLHRVDHHEQLASALERVRIARGTREILAVLEQELRAGIGADVRVLVAKPRGPFIERSKETMQLPTDTVLVAVLRETTRPLDLSPDGPLLALLPRKDRDWAVANDVELAAPVKHRDGNIGAIVVLRGKRGGSIDRRDRWLVTTLISAAAAAWDTDRFTESDRPRNRRSRRAACLDEAAFECPRCGLVAQSRPLPCCCGGEAVLAALPRRLGGTFLVRRRLGAGGMGIAYLARDTRLDREVALKTLPHLRSDAVTRLRDEARAMAALNHESLATIYGLEVWRRTPVLVVEYFPGGTLARRLADSPLSPGDAIEMGIRLARALAYMHARGVLHRDLKPSNIAYSATGAIKLLDFGLATLVRSSTDAGSELSAGVLESEPFGGTPAYLPPEALRGAPPGPAFDLWAMSVTMLEAITGMNPFSASDPAGAMHRAAEGSLREPGRVRWRLPGTHPALSAFFERALARAPELRFQAASELQSALEAAARVLAP